jgi:hypothetical protein
MEQKIQLLIAMINDPQLPDLDEPFAGLDPLNSAQSLRSVTYRALVRARLATRGFTPDTINRSLQPVALDLISLRATAVAKATTTQLRLSWSR